MVEIHPEFPCLSRRPLRGNLRNEERSLSDGLGRRAVFQSLIITFSTSTPSVSSMRALYTCNPCCLSIFHASFLVGVNTCTDQDYRCISWVRSNRWYCRTNQHVRTYCKKSCGLCPRPTVRPRPPTVRPRPPTLRPTPPTKRPRPPTVRPRPPTLRPTPPTKRPTPTTKKPVQPSKRNSLKFFRYIL